MDKKVQAMEECCENERSALPENAQQEAAPLAAEMTEEAASEERPACESPATVEESLPLEQETDSGNAAAHAEIVAVCAEETVASDTVEQKSPAVEEMHHFVAKAEVQKSAPQLSSEEPRETHASEEPVQPPEVQKPVSLFFNGLTGFGITQQGESHKRKGNIPCQDSMDVRLLQNKPIILCAVADGVGECEYSHYGSRKAVTTVLDILQRRLEDAAAQETFVFRDHARMQGLMLEAFRAALHAVDQLAEEMKKLPFSFQSTLTAAVYDGSQLYIGHAGDDGLVALAADGSCKMLTRRHKGEASNSVFPLQARNMDFIAVDQEITAFALMTDGVLDAVVGNEAFENRVYYPFFKQLFETVLINEVDVREICDAMDQMLASKEYRERVSDDLSLVVVTNQQLLINSEKPQFDAEAWNRQTAEITKKINAKLYPSDPPKPKQKRTTPRNYVEYTPPKIEHADDKRTAPEQEPAIRQKRSTPSERDRPDYSFQRPGTSYVSVSDKHAPDPVQQEKRPGTQQQTEEFLSILKTLGCGEEIWLWARKTIAAEKGSLRRVRNRAQIFGGDALDLISEAMRNLEKGE